MLKGLFTALSFVLAMAALPAPRTKDAKKRRRFRETLLGVTRDYGSSETLRITLVSLVPPQHEPARGDYVLLPARNRPDVVTGRARVEIASFASQGN